MLLVLRVFTFTGPHAAQNKSILRGVALLTAIHASSFTTCIELTFKPTRKGSLLKTDLYELNRFLRE